jgi:hypothetical protein
MDDFCALSYAQAVTAQFLIVHTRGFDPAKNMRDFPATNTRDVPVEHGTGDALLVLGHHRMVAGTGFLRTTVIATRAGLHTKNQLYHVISREIIYT